MGAIGAVAKVQIKGVVSQSAEPVAEPPPVITVQDNAAVLDDGAAVAAAIALRQHGVCCLIGVVEREVIGLLHDDRTVVHHSMGAVAHHMKEGLTAVEVDGAALHPDLCGAALPQCEEPVGVIAPRKIFRLFHLIKIAAGDPDI